MFLAARAVSWALGVDFDFDNLGTWWQIADAELLRTRLWSTLFYLHGQPPLFNLLIGAALKTGAFGWVMACVYFVVCLAGILALHSVCCAVLGSRPVSLGIALWFCVSPDVLLFNEKLFYDSLVPWLLCVGLWAVHRGLAPERAGSLVLGFGMFAAVVLIRSMFHPVWLLAAVAGVWGLSGFRGRVLACAAGPVAVVGLVLAKNLVVFGFVGLSSWAPLNLVGVTVEKMPMAERAALVAAGRLTPLAAINAFGPIERLLPLLPPGKPIAAADPVLDATRKANGEPNMNHWAMLAASRLRGPDVMAGVRADPEMYAAVVATSLLYFHRPASEFRDVRRNLGPIDRWARLANGTVGLQPAAWLGSSLDDGRADGALVLVSYGALVVTLGTLAACAGMARAVLGAIRRRRALDADHIVLALLLGTAAFIMVVSTLFDTLENNRARYTIAPLMTVAAASVVMRRRVSGVLYPVFAARSA